MVTHAEVACSPEWSSDSLTIEKNYVRLLESKSSTSPLGATADRLATPPTAAPTPNRKGSTGHLNALRTTDFRGVVVWKTKRGLPDIMSLIGTTWTSAFARTHDQPPRSSGSRAPADTGTRPLLPAHRRQYVTVTNYIAAQGHSDSGGHRSKFSLCPQRLARVRRCVSVDQRWPQSEHCKCTRVPLLLRRYCQCVSQLRLLRHSPQLAP